jgi:hypothetical protein
MFVVRFTNIYKETEDYYYNHIEHAEKHFNLFRDDESGLYRNICIMDESNNTVLAILPFQNGKPCKIIRNGDIVKLKSELK